MRRCERMVRWERMRLVGMYLMLAGIFFVELWVVIHERVREREREGEREGVGKHTLRYCTERASWDPRLFPCWNFLDVVESH